ncbi:MAG: hypothetical protein WKH64_10005 [Chloroflexia bacterium]
MGAIATEPAADGTPAPQRTVTANPGNVNSPLAIPAAELRRAGWRFGGGGEAPSGDDRRQLNLNKGKTVVSNYWTKGSGANTQLLVDIRWEFPTASNAEAFFTYSDKDIVNNTDTPTKRLTDAPDLGDQTNSYEYREPAANGDGVFYVVLFRQGARVGGVAVLGTTATLKKAEAYRLARLGVE